MIVKAAATKPLTKTALARQQGVSVSSLYYRPRQPAKDWHLKNQIEAVLKDNPSYGHRRLAAELHANKKRVLRVMRLFGLKPYRRRGRKWKKPKEKTQVYENLLLAAMPLYPHHIWVADFTELSWHGQKVFVATVLDLYTRQIVGVNVALRRGAPLTAQALWQALFAHPRPEIFHSDNGKEYEAASFIGILRQFGILVSRSRPGAPWENGYQESWYDKFQIDLGDPNRFDALGELVAEIYYTVWVYNHTRIHSILKMPPAVFALKQKTAMPMTA